MTYKVTAPLVIIPAADGTSSDWYGYVDAVVPEGHNDDRCKQLAKEGFLEEDSPRPARRAAKTAASAKTAKDADPAEPTGGPDQAGEAAETAASSK